jgi:hypothetical protein
MEGLVKKGLLRARTAANKWIVPDNEDELMPPDGYGISFVPFHEHGLAMPHTGSSGGCWTTTTSSYNT